ncbi:molecular chaperone [Ancistrocladus abbreviatus]
MKISQGSIQNLNSRDSDIDFSDVFGGPPRRSSFHGGNLSGVDVDDGAGIVSGNPWSGYGGKPVFGDEIISRRPYASEDFFDDIFGGDQSLSSSPRMAARDPFSSSPGSRVLSPARPLPSRLEPFGSFPQFSLPAKLSSTDFQAASSVKCSPYTDDEGLTGNTYSSSSSMPRFSSQTLQNHWTSRGRAYSTSRRSPLSSEFSLNSGGMTEDTKPEGVEAGTYLDKDLERAEFPNDSSQFHFSIHKWASKGLPLIMSLRRRNNSRSNENGKLKRCFSSNREVENDILVSEIHRQDVSVYDFQSNKSGILSTSEMKYEKHGDAARIYSSTEEIIEPGKIFSEAVPKVPQSVIFDSLQKIDSKAPKDVISNSSDKDRKPPIHSQKFSSEEAVVVSEIAVNQEKFITEHLRSASHDIKVKKGNDKLITRDGGMESMVKTKEEQYLNTESVSGYDEVENFSMSGLQKLPGHKGKVKEFVKIFNQGTCCQTRINVDTQRMSGKWRDKASIKVEGESKFSLAEKHDKMEAPDIIGRKTCLDATTKANGSHTPSMEQVSDVDAINRISEVSSTEDDNPSSGNEPTSDGFRASLSNIDVTCPAGILIEELSKDLDKLSEIGEQQQEELKVLESKILQWSKGKEGNIRALLSTLQYVLWSDGGWKPVALVDIIEANAVRRAYQKALLCLHPDKLQQKGAAPYQKYIAEKVFDILQDAWDHFNSLGLF